MINLIFEIVNPFSKKFAGLFAKHGRLSNVKAWELNVYRTNVIFLMALDFSIKKDHAGFKLRFGLLSFETEFQIYDSRHWDYQTGKWEGT
jgi:hypothetical protein